MHGRKGVNNKMKQGRVCTFVVPLPGTQGGVLVVHAGDVHQAHGGVVLRDPEHLT